MDEEYRPSEYQKELMKYGTSGILISQLRHIGCLINGSASVFSICDEDFESSELAKKLKSFSDSTLELTTMLSSMRSRVINRETGNG